VVRAVIDGIDRRPLGRQEPPEPFVGLMDDRLLEVVARHPRLVGDHDGQESRLADPPQRRG
jgi:hypothetical protein